MNFDVEVLGIDYRGLCECHEQTRWRLIFSTFSAWLGSIVGTGTFRTVIGKRIDRKKWSGSNSARKMQDTRQHGLDVREITSLVAI